MSLIFPVHGHNVRPMLEVEASDEPERCGPHDGRAHQRACRRGVRRQSRRLSEDAALGKARDVWEDLEMREGIPARKRCQPHSPPATALHDAIALNGAFRRFVGTMRGKLTVEVSLTRSMNHGDPHLPTNPGDPHPDPLPSHPMGAEREQRADPNFRVNTQPSAVGSGVQCANFFGEFSSGRRNGRRTPMIARKPDRIRQVK